jgi:hypothetical protein
MVRSTSETVCNVGHSGSAALCHESAFAERPAAQSSACFVEFAREFGLLGEAALRGS